MNLSFAITSLEQGLAFGVMALGVFISFRILDFADLSVDGTLPLGAAVSARLLTAGINPFYSLIAALLAGGIAGAITGFLNTKLKIAPLLAGILTMTSLYSINLRIMGRPNIPLIGKSTIFSLIEKLGLPYPWNHLILLILIIIIVKFLLDAFLNTQIGFALRATGDNPQMIRSMGISTNSMKMLGLILSNALVALSGAMVAQYQGFSDVNMGVGTIVAGLASVIIGEVIIGKSSIMIATIGVVVGSILYRFSISIALNLGLAASDLKLLTALLVIIFLSTPRIKKALR
ncbi:ABC transporter permease [Halanaerobium salsuginis]|jgi:putative ABC transport system permease protein|uniref:Putative ABC transport system permease protein n=1 Tax=Halanaerobium salsuginis TaxID=29563 RepID=A0A1I4H2T9_9FIRM|nr:ABC transporter permease [Halanaerobium salsuginis]SFL36100.1 putative ABC transport system permease protein [Halanaerobium salsuginis]